MTDRSAVLRAIYAAVDDLNAQRGGKRKIEKAKDAPLYDKTGQLDSLELVNLVVAVEQKIEKELGILLTLASDRAFSEQKSPFKTVGTLANFVETLIKEGKASKRKERKRRRK